MQARRVEDGNYKALEQPGDYSVIFRDGEVAGVWLWVPESPRGASRITAEGYGEGDHPEWTITLDEDGRITVDPSIDCRWGQGEEKHWHGHLVNDFWS